MIPEDPNPQLGPSDKQLRGLFSVLRQEDEAQVPPFRAAQIPRPGKPPFRKPAWRLAGASVLAATILAAFLWLRLESPRHPTRSGRVSDARVASITEWKPPTDFLLHTPGREILRTAPVIRSQPYPLSIASPPNRKSRTKRATTPLFQ